jgi:hypothetical protein
VVDAGVVEYQHAPRPPIHHQYVHGLTTEPDRAPMEEGGGFGSRLLRA